MTRHSKKFWEIVVISLLMLILIALFVIRPIVNEIINKSVALEKKTYDLENVKKEQINELTLLKNKQKIDDMYNLAFSYLPEDINSGDFVVQIEAIENITDQNQQELSFKKNTKQTGEETENKAQNSETATENSPGLDKIGFLLIQDGAFPDLINFFKNIEDMSRYYTINAISVVTNIGEGTVNTKIEGNIYYKPSITYQGDAVSLTENEEATIYSLKHFGNFITSSTGIPFNSDRIDPFL